jgi:GT2 family glycosyltransferase
MHDDILITDFFWSKRVREGLTDFDVVGIVGNSRRLTCQPSWIMTNLNGIQDDFKYLTGAIGQGSKFPPEKLDVFGPTGLECKLMDGVFFAAYSETLHTSGLRFDPAFKFHFYDMDFCRTAEKLNLRMGTIPLSIVHASYGIMDDKWRDSYSRYLNKWND